jgi:hypothetical protein
MAHKFGGNLPKSIIDGRRKGVTKINASVKEEKEAGE